MTIVCVLYITVGFYGYIEYGADCQDSITLNLESWFVFLYTACVLTMLLISVVGKGTGPVWELWSSGEMKSVIHFKLLLLSVLLRTFGGRLWDTPGGSGYTLGVVAIVKVQVFTASALRAPCVSVAGTAPLCRCSSVCVYMCPTPSSSTSPWLSSDQH